MTTTVEVFFDLSAAGGSFFTLDDSTKGVLDSSTYLLAGDLSTDITSDVRAASISRGRNRQTDKIDAATAAIVLNNNTRDYDPSYTPGPYYGNIVPGKRIRVSSAGVSIFDGAVADWNLDYDLGGLALTTIQAEDGLAKLARCEFDDWTTTGGQHAGARIIAVLDRSEVAYPASVSIDTGVATLQADSVSWGSNVLNYLQLVTTTEQGYLYVDRSGVLTFGDRNATLNQTGAVTFSSGGVAFETIQIDYGSEYLYNWVAVDREGGTQQSSQDATSQDTYGVRRLSIGGLLYDSDSQSADTADYLLNKYKDPELRITSITVQIENLSMATAAEVLSLDITDVVDVSFQPPGGGSPITGSVIIEGIDHEIAPASHRVTFSLGTADDRQFLVLDNATLGVLDSNILAF